MKKQKGIYCLPATKTHNGEWSFFVKGIPFGSPTELDSDGDYFDQTTDFFGVPNPVLLYNHGNDEKNRPKKKLEKIGKVIKSMIKPDGVWFHVVLDQAKADAQRVWQAYKKGLVRASTGSPPNMIRYGRLGHVASWLASELSLIDIDASVNRLPANMASIAMPSIKSKYKTTVRHTMNDNEPQGTQESATSIAPNDAKDSGIAPEEGVKETISAASAHTVFDQLNQKDQEIKYIKARMDEAIQRQVRTESEYWFDSMVGTGKALPANKSTVVELLVTLAKDDESAPIIIHSMKSKSKTRVDALKQLFETRDPIYVHSGVIAPSANESTHFMKSAAGRNTPEGRRNRIDELMGYLPETEDSVYRVYRGEMGIDYSRDPYSGGRM